MVKLLPHVVEQRLFFTAIFYVYHLTKPNVVVTDGTNKMCLTPHYTTRIMQYGNSLK